VKALRYTLYLALLLVFFDQLLNWSELRDGFFGARRVAPFDPPLFSAAQRTSLMQIDAAVAEGGSPLGGLPFDADLGWAPLPGGRDRFGDYDARGARADGSPLPPPRSPAALASAAGRVDEDGDQPLRVAAFGCSFTHGGACAPDETWPAQLERVRAGRLAIANFGVHDYGVDQALLRARRELPELQPDEVWLGWRPGATLDITTLYPPALDHGRATLAFKPRFELAGGALTLWPCPAREPQDIMGLCTDQAAFLRALGGHDPWVQRAPLAWAPAGSDWRHHFAVTRLLLTSDDGGERDPEPWLADRSTPVAQLQQALVLAMAQDAEAVSARFRLLVLPDRRDLRWRQRTGLQGYWADALVQLADRGIEVLDVSPALESLGAADEAGLWLDDGQYGPALNAAVAEFLDTRVNRSPAAR
jgi:hypothetical protein